MSEMLLKTWIREVILSEEVVKGGAGGLLKYRKRVQAFLDTVREGRPFTLSQDSNFR